MTALCGRRGYSVRDPVAVARGKVGLKEVHLRDSRGDGGAYSRLQVRGGTHRVQRVPKTEVQAAFQPRTATVAVLPRRRRSTCRSIPNDLQVEVYSLHPVPGWAVGQLRPTRPSESTHKADRLRSSRCRKKSSCRKPGVRRRMRVLRGARMLERENRRAQAKISHSERRRAGRLRRALGGRFRTSNSPGNRSPTTGSRLTGEWCRSHPRRRKWGR